jgi:hypothetical protein
MVDAVLDLLADGFHPTIGSVNLHRVTRGQEMSARGGEEITAGEAEVAASIAGGWCARSWKRERLPAKRGNRAGPLVLEDCAVPSDHVFRSD